MRNCVLIYILLLQQVFGSQIVKIVLLTQEGQEEIVGWYKNVMDSLKSSLKYETISLRVAHEDADKPIISDAVSQGGNLIVDLCWYTNEKAKELSLAGNGIPYVRIDVSISPFLDFLDRYLDFRNSTDVAVIFENPSYLDQSIYYWIDSTRLRMHMTESLDLVAARRLRDLKPIPNSFAIFAKTSNMRKIFKFALQEKLVGLPDRWHLVFLDFSHRLFDRSLIEDLQIHLLLPSPDVCCRLLQLDTPCTCPETSDVPRSFLEASMGAINDVLEDLDREGLELAGDDFTGRRRFEELLNGSGLRVEDGPTLRPRLDGLVEVGGGVGVAARYEDGVVEVLENKTVSAVRAFYRIGITHALPWSFKVKDPTTGTWNWTGYCVDFAAKLAEMIDFDFEFVEPKSGTFGEKINGVWDGVVGDLVSGETDLAVTALILTADKEEVVDFVAPYFEQTGITIVIRKPIRKTSLFKFMTVLKLEVWLSIVASLIVTGFMVWFLDKYSPYSARNNKKAYPYPCREFTLKESFWFALTSFTPQGGGEAPKALSGRTLVAAYWLFVVLMLATFTANLAAFLTVERMQAPVQSLEQLARQSRINYTVVKDSETHKYFINMKNAEDTLYRMWKELTLNASVDDTRYRVWDYPIKEQYGHILLAINDSNPVPTAEAGFRSVDEHVDADYAFIHDSSEIRYEISRNCNLTEVGEVFAEKPYAVAIQQGSHLHDDISKSILKLQKDRYFEILQGKWWNHSSKGNCPSTDDNEGITLESLGGVFIATLFGLALAMITLAGEVMYYKRKRKVDDVKTVKKQNLGFPQDSQVSIITPNKLEPFPITIGTTFKPVNLKEKMQKERDDLKMAHVKLYPRARNRITEYRD